MATFIAKKNLWQARRTIKGKREAFYGRTEDEAERKADEAVGSLPDSKGPKPGTIEDFIGTTIAPLKAGREKATRDQWVWAMGLYILPVIGHLKPEDLELRHCLEILAKARNGKSAGTEHAVRKHLSPVVRLLARQRAIPYNYLEEIRAPAQKRREAVLSIHDAWVIVESAPALARNATILSAFCSLRRGEMMQVSKKNIVRGTLQVRGKLKTDSAKRDIPLPASLEAMLLDGMPDGGLLVAYRDGTLPHEDTLGDFVKKECERHGFPAASLHTLRHTFASTMDALGCPRGVLMGLMGHSPKQITDGYVHPTTAAKRAWMERLWDSRLDTSLEGGGIQVCHSTSSTFGILDADFEPRLGGGG